MVSASIEGIHDFTGSRILDSGPLPGLLQSAFRAETFAILRALQIVQAHRGTAYIWSDCAGVVRRLKRILTGHSVKTNGSHADLWCEIQQLLRARAGCTHVARVAAHQQADNADSAFHAWCFRHNGVADRQAVRANFSRPASFWTLWQRHVDASAGIAWFNRTVQQVQLAISQDATRHESPWKVDIQPHEPVTLRPCPAWRPLPPLTLPPAAVRWYGDSLVRNILSWFWAALDRSCHEVTWVAHSQLYIDFMLTTGMPGPVKLDRWCDGLTIPFISLRCFTFRQRVRWFTKVLKECLRHMKVQLATDYGRPVSQIIHMFTGVIAIPWPRQRLQWVDDWMLQHGGQTYKRQSGAIDSLPYADASGLFPPHVVTTFGF